MGTIESQLPTIGGMLTWCFGLIDVFALTAWASASFDPVYLIFVGILFALLSNLTASAYVAVKTVDATVSHTDGKAW